ncbi:TIGR03619 family F420-dependent LLM class oxidoreductase [Solicola gregarius]|uniref:TIGR03619 family F420-dependent LLM class oxidoreductase n=1 Tax=Solicola gregarius TaxID=2908642 RepID=A0AA46TLR3_9ACTN|nr:TIGR03619 family F420-dependent LLM class oxidoreductase [Solicola gregarius]UYM07400.1 TIGR03619 family F420-dependent LLM class oxidoreductase [Solicola gregarius]
MKFALSWNTAYYGTGADQMSAIAQHAEGLGFEAIYVPEHIALSARPEPAQLALPADTEVVDPLGALAYLAATTERILLGTGVLLLPYHHPVTLAKQLATIDLLSKGRLRLVTIGLGTVPAEAAAFGVDYAARGRVADDAMDALRLLWAGDRDGVSHDGEFYSFDSLTSFPKPYQADGVPLHVGGSSRAAARRAGARGSGWFPGGRLSLPQRAELWQLVQDTAAAAGRSLDGFDHTRWGTIDMTTDDVAARAEQGVTRLVVAPTGSTVDEQRAELSAFAQRHRLVASS